VIFLPIMVYMLLSRCVIISGLRKAMTQKLPLMQIKTLEKARLPQRKGAKTIRKFDPDIYKARHRTENLFSRLKQGVVTRAVFKPK